MKPLEAWEALLRQAIAKDFDEQQQALFQIGLVLERHSRPNSDAGTLYEDNLQRELLRLTLDDTRQAAAVLYLSTLARNQPEQAKSFIYAFGRAKPDVVIAPLLQLMAERGKTFAPDAAYQAVIALESCVKTGSDVMKAALKANDPSDLLDEWAEVKDTLLADKADFVLEKIEALLDAEGDA